MALITCTHCGASGNAPDHILGQQVRCSKCKQSFVAAAGGSSPPPPPPPPPVDDVEEDEGFPTGDEIHSPPKRNLSRRNDDDDEVEDDEELDSSRPSRRPARRSSSGNNGIGDLLMFRRMVAPVIIMVLFWIGVVFAIIGGLVMLATGAMAGNAVAIGVGLAWMIIGPLYVRLLCEVMIVIFRINETLTDIYSELRRRN